MKLAFQNSRQSQALADFPSLSYKAPTCCLKRRLSRPMLQSAQPLLDAVEGVAYLVDRERHIAAIGRPNWNRFAEHASAAFELDPEKLVGRDLLDFIQGDEVKQSYVGFLDRLARENAASVVIPFRCDEPTVRREMRLVITPVHEGVELAGFLFVSTTISEGVRPPLNLFDFGAQLANFQRDRTLPVILMCSYCQLIRLGDLWMEAEEYYRRGGSSSVRISHGVCKSCRRTVIDPQLRAPSQASVATGN